MLGKKFLTAVYRCCSCWSKNIISHDLAILEGVGDIKIDCARTKHIYLTNIDLKNLDVGRREGFLTQFFNAAARTRI